MIVTVSDLLEYGARNAKTSTELCKVLGISRKELQRYIYNERRRGVAICADTGRNPGYYLAEDAHELRAYCECLQHRINEIKGTLHACRKAKITDEEREKCNDR